jgi:Asp-tRNA(Asn)/Glu-tRNA(Gln) amidotransferase A subunit family amidase
MDKLGPMCRSVEDCAFVLDAIHGSDGHDPTARDAAFHWNASLPVSSLRIGYFKSAFDLPERDTNNRVQHLTHSQDQAAIEVLRKLGVSLIPVEVPEMEYAAMRLILTAEAAAAFDELTRSGRDRELVQQGPNDWANTFRIARFITATDYINANRVRTLAMQKWAELFRKVDVIVSPTSASGLNQLLATNLTGHPAVILPNGFREANPDRGDRTMVPVSLTFIGGLYDEARLLAVARAYQQATDWHRRHPSLG